MVFGNEAGTCCWCDYRFCFILSILYACLKYIQTLEMLVGDSMNDKLSIAMFGQKRLSREGGIEIVVKELCTRMAQKGHQLRL